MLLDVKFKEGTRNKNKPGRLLVLKCDMCEVVFERPFGPRCFKQDLHACSRKCHGLLERKGGPRDEKKRHTSMLHYGVEHPRKSKIVEESRKQTCIIRHGVPYVLQLQHVINAAHTAEVESIRTESLKRVNLNGEPAKKRHATMKRMGTYSRTSKPEEQCYIQLCQQFGVEDIERQVLINGWSIDFYVKSINTYVQEDGVYHHGLDRHIDVISEHKTSRDRSIHKRWLLDKQQDAWFEDNHKRLIRVTDLCVLQDNTWLIMLT